MNKYSITNNKDDERYHKTFENQTEAKHWIINTLDLSKDWTIFNGLWENQVNFNFERDLEEYKEEEKNRKEYEQLSIEEIEEMLEQIKIEDI